jgi:DNA-binding NarL/FixJ family response regulator
VPLSSPLASGVTGREREILGLIASGLSNKRIAIELRRSVKTIEKHRANLMRKLRLHNVAEVTRFAMQSGLLSEVKDAKQNVSGGSDASRAARG